jgi:TolA-binding protein
MTCEKCKVDLLSLVYGEFEPSEAEGMHRVIANCSSCSAEFEKLRRTVRLTRQLEELEPPSALDRALLERARAHVAEAKAASRAKPAVDDERVGLWAALLRWIGTFAMGPQVAMATLMLLVIGIGLWYLPDRTPSESATGTVVHAPDNEGLPVEEPATATEELGAQAEEGAIQLDEEDKPEEEPARRVRVAQRPAGDVIDRPLEDLIQPRDAEEPAPVAQQQTATGALPEAAVATQTPPANQRALFDRGVQREARGDFVGAIEDFDRVVRVPDEATRELVPNALHRLASSHRRNGNCEGAIPHYEALVERFSGRYGQMGPVMIELAECYRRTGRLGEASSTLERARSFRSTQDRARVEQQRLEEMNRARRAPMPAESVAPRQAY